MLPEWPDLEIVPKKNEEAKQKNLVKFNASHGARPLPDFDPNMHVRQRLPTDKQWSQPIEVGEKKE